MKKKNGFTMVELLATLVILGIVITIVIITVSNSFGNAKNKTEEVFIKTIEDAMTIYLDSDARKLNYSVVAGELRKSRGTVKIYKGNKVDGGTLTFNDVINSEYRPINVVDLVNPANEKVQCFEGTPADIPIAIYRDSDYVYYYKIEKEAVNCLLSKEGTITNLPSGVAWFKTN